MLDRLDDDTTFVRRGLDAPVMLAFAQYQASILFRAKVLSALQRTYGKVSHFTVCWFDDPFLATFLPRFSITMGEWMVLRAREPLILARCRDEELISVSRL